MTKTQSFLLVGGIIAAVLLAGLLILVVLATLLLPAIAASRARARQAQCASHLTQIGMAWTRYRTTQPDPRVGEDWPVRLAPYMEDNRIIHCPADTTGPLSYGVNSRAYRMSAGDSQRIVALDYALPVVNVVGPMATDDWPSVVRPRHLGQANALFFDGSVRAFPPPDINPRICTVHDRRWRPARDIMLLKPGCSADSLP